MAAVFNTASIASIIIASTKIPSASPTAFQAFGPARFDRRKSPVRVSVDWNAHEPPANDARRRDDGLRYRQPWANQPSRAPARRAESRLSTQVVDMRDVGRSQSLGLLPAATVSKQIACELGCGEAREGMPWRREAPRVGDVVDKEKGKSRRIRMRHAACE